MVVTDESNRENFVKFQTLLSTGSFKALAINFTSDGNPIIRLFRLSPTGLVRSTKLYFEVET